MGKHVLVNKFLIILNKNNNAKLYITSHSAILILYDFYQQKI